MNVWVVIVDYGLNGADCAAVFDHEPTEDEVQALELEYPYKPNPERPIHTGATGYGGWEVEQREVRSA